MLTGKRKAGNISCTACLWSSEAVQKLLELLLKHACHL